jgi:REP element-mobilizing transposase RayT
MSLHSYTKIRLHIIWETLNRDKLLFDDAAKTVSAFLFNYSKDKGIFMRKNYVNPEHVHALVELPTNMTVEECVKLLKGASSHVINRERLVHGKFSWGRGYAAFSVSESQISKVSEYISNQKEHHKIKSFCEEYEEFILKHKIEVNR